MMTQPGPDARIIHDRSDWLPLRTLILLRWMAVGGQLAAITVAQEYVSMQLPLGACLMVIGAAIIANLVLSNIYPQNKRLTETESVLALLFDTAQLAVLLFFTGGLTNPFAFLILAPVIVSASALELRATIALGALAATCTSIIAKFYIPLRFLDGALFEIPPLFKIGFWFAIVIGIAFLGLYARRISTEVHAMSDALLATQLALAREQKLTDLGGVIAAAAHELGTPLATIKLVSTELFEELSAHPEWQADAALIRSQTDRCRDILREMGKIGKDDLHLRSAPFSQTIFDAAEPHLLRGIDVRFAFDAMGAPLPEPQIMRRPELIHGVRNLIQNAVDFAKGTVWVDGTWSQTHINLRISDDGPGFPAHVIGRIGDPFLRARSDAQMVLTRPGYEGMGLGLFIAKTLLERTGAALSFANGSDPFLTVQERGARCGAIVIVTWPIAALHDPRGGTLGLNTPMGT